jgi:GNAT superfamily N-acetyltransferase
MERDLTIRPVTAADLPALAALLLPVFRAGDTYTVPTDISAEEAIAYWCAPEKCVFIAEDGIGPVGTYSIRPNQGGGGAHVCNCSYVTSEAARGHGIARAMLDHSLAEARARVYRAMQYNFVVSTNTRAIDTWTRAGFETVGRLPGAFRHPGLGYVDALVMFRSLV